MNENNFSETINYRRMEFQLKESKRQFTLPDSVSLENIEAILGVQ